MLSVLVGILNVEECMKIRLQNKKGDWVDYIIEYTYSWPHFPIAVMYAISPVSVPDELPIPYWTSTYIEGVVEITKPCHGCSGKGWVAIEGRPVKCIICEGKGELKTIDDSQKPKKEMTGPECDNKARKWQNNINK